MRDTYAIGELEQSPQGTAALGGAASAPMLQGFGIARLDRTAEAAQQVWIARCSVCTHEQLRTGARRRVLADAGRLRFGSGASALRGRHSTGSLTAVRMAQR